MRLMQLIFQEGGSNFAVLPVKGKRSENTTFCACLSRAMMVGDKNGDGKNSGPLKRGSVGLP